MIFISHRGNLTGDRSILENHPSYIDTALGEGYDVEVDVWWYDNTYYLGHDFPSYKMPQDYLSNSKLWFHCKNVEALYHISNYSSVKYFWHQEDDVTLTSNRKIWTYPGKKLVKGAIAVVPEVGYDGNLWDCYAICTDNVYEYERMYESRNTDKWPTEKLS
jgi:hypothetical protein